jgi:hypothetical protein
MNLRVLLIVLLLGLLENAFSQISNEYNRFSLGMKFGFGLNVTSQPVNNEVYSELGVSVIGGVAFLIPKTRKDISLAPEVTYSMHFFKDSDVDNTTYQVNYIEIPVICNIRLWGIEEFYGYRTINLEVGFGFSKPVSSNVRFESSSQDDLFSKWLEYEQISNPFEKAKPQRFGIFGINTRLTGENIKTIGLRYTRMFTGLYEDNPSMTSYNLDTKARCLSLEMLFYF